MNDKIKQLAEQAETKEIGYYFFDREKFAELIVQECAGIACEHMELNEGTDYNIGSKIKQHFGVEE